MKESGFIILKTLKKHTIPLMLLLVAMVLFFINVFYPSVVYAHEQLANVQYSINVVDQNDINQIAFEKDLLANSETTSISLQNIDVALTKNSIIEVNLMVKNVVEDDVQIRLMINQESLKNFIAKVYVNGEDCGELSNFDYVLGYAENVAIKVIFKIDNIAQNAILSGAFCLNLNRVV